MTEVLIGLFGIVPALVTYFTMKSKNESNLKLAKTQHEAEMNQIKIQHKHELDMKKQEHLRELEKLETEYRLKSKEKEDNIVMEKTGAYIDQVLKGMQVPGLSDNIQAEMNKKMQEEMTRNLARKKKD